MTECERLVKEGFVPEEFLTPETRECEVPLEMKKLWAIQIDLIRQVQIICERHGLRFFTEGGTSIGALRHQGFIPWDDDVDLMMPRADYNRFIDYCQTELPEPYFLQIPTTDKYFYSPHIWLRNSNTTGIARGDYAVKCNNGIPIHIFPIDSFHEDEAFLKFLKTQRLKNITAHNSYHFRGMPDRKMQRYLLKAISPLVLGGSRASFFEKKERFLTKMSEIDTGYAGIFSTIVHTRFRLDVWKKEVFDDIVMMPFEFYHVPVPSGYEDILKQQYGDFRKFPPEEKRICKHSWETDPDTPYQEYCSRKYGVKY